MLPPPPQFYKYLLREHAESMVNEGRIRIGTLEDYKNKEKYGKAIGDDQEGHRSLSITTGSNKHLHIKSLATPVGTFSNCQIIGGGTFLESYEKCPPFYLYCVSINADIKIMKEFGCDTCVQVHNPISFFKEVTDELKRLAKTKSDATVGPCVYKEKKEVISGDHLHAMREIRNNPIPPFYQKPPSYAYQAEARAVWQPIESTPEPLFITCAGIKDYCRIIML